MLFNKRSDFISISRLSTGENCPCYSTSDQSFILTRCLYTSENCPCCSTDDQIIILQDTNLQAGIITSYLFFNNSYFIQWQTQTPQKQRRLPSLLFDSLVFSPAKGTRTSLYDGLATLSFYHLIILLNGKHKPNVRECFLLKQRNYFPMRRAHISLFL